jgi:hypothetical protein
MQNNGCYYLTHFLFSFGQKAENTIENNLFKMKNFMKKLKTNCHENAVVQMIMLVTLAYVFFPFNCIAIDGFLVVIQVQP